MRNPRFQRDIFFLFTTYTSWGFPRIGSVRTRKMLMPYEQKNIWKGRYYETSNCSWQDTNPGHRWRGPLHPGRTSACRSHRPSHCEQAEKERYSKNKNNLRIIHRTYRFSIVVNIRILEELCLYQSLHRWYTYWVELSTDGRIRCWIQFGVGSFVNWMVSTPRKEGGG